MKQKLKNSERNLIIVLSQSYCTIQYLTIKRLLLSVSMADFKWHNLKVQSAKPSLSSHNSSTKKKSYHLDGGGTKGLSITKHSNYWSPIRYYWTPIKSNYWSPIRYCWTPITRVLLAITDNHNKGYFHRDFLRKCSDESRRSKHGVGHLCTLQPTL